MPVTSVASALSLSWHLWERVSTLSSWWAPSAIKTFSAGKRTQIYSLHYCFKKGGKLYVFGSLQYQSVGVPLQIPLNTQACGQMQVQYQKVNCGERNPRLEDWIFMCWVLSKVILLWAKQWLQRHSRPPFFQNQAIKLQKLLMPDNCCV